MAEIIHSLRRLVPKRSWGEGPGVGVVVWTVLGALALLYALVLVTLTVDLLHTRGRLDRPLPEAFDLLADERYEGPRIGDLGLVPTAYRFGNSPAWSWLPHVVARVPATWKSGSALLLLGTLLALSLLMVLWAFSQAKYHSGEAARRQANWLRSAIHRQTLRLGPSDPTDGRFRSALQLFTADVEHIRDALSEWRAGLVRGNLLVPLLVATILLIDWRLGLQCLIPAGACWWVYRHERERRLRDRQLANALVETEIQFLAEGLSKTRLVRGYNIEEFEQQKFQQHMERLNRESQNVRRQERWLYATGGTLLLVGVLLIVVLIGLRVLAPGNAIPFASGTTMFVALVLAAIEVPRLERVVSNQSVMLLAAERIFRYLDEIPEVGQAVGAKFIEPVSRSITYESITYRRGEQLLFDNLDLKLTAGTQVAFVGLDPQPPRALAHLLPRFIEPQSGRVLFDGQDIAWGTLESVRAEAMFVSGDDPVLTGTVAENLLCGDARFKLQDAVEAAKVTHAHSFISRLPQGYETMLGDHGETLTPGQAYRLGLARAVLRNPAVLIIEEPQVQFDDDTKSMIDDAYQRIAQNRTVIYLPARLTTVKRCGQIVLLHEGKVEAIGSHSELRKGSELYRHWDYVRFNAYRRQRSRDEATADGESA
ncbi:MAG: ABC transporter ATP-binding protein [Planctomycetaceae bacterium]|nr:ABC transporter ATP-binding protein [Planctomycetaceae bacterium]